MSKNKRHGARVSSALDTWNAFTDGQKVDPDEMVLYICGPMTGIPEHNYPAFHAAEERLVLCGFTVLNPARHAADPDTTPREMFMRVDLTLIACVADAVIVLPGYETSQGAYMEIAAAISCGKPVYDYETWSASGILNPIKATLHDPRQDDVTALSLVPTPPAHPARPLIGLLGHKGAGKDTLGRVLTEKHGYTRASFADDLRLEVFKALVRTSKTEQAPKIVESQNDYNAFLSYVEAHKHDALDLPSGWPRQLLQAWGQMRRDIYGDDYWINRIALGEGVVVTDVRFPNEAAAIKKAGGILWRVVRPGKDGDGHISETLLDTIPVDMKIFNNGTIAQIEEALTLQFATIIEGSWANEGKM